MAIKTNIQLEIISNSPFEAKAKMEALKTLSSQDADILEKVAKLSKNPKAIAKLKSNFGMLEAFLG